eukprot:scaffold12430_cov70-Phaeocystis_antarctica.AAC.2
MARFASIASARPPLANAPCTSCATVRWTSTGCGCPLSRARWGVSVARVLARDGTMGNTDHRSWAMRRSSRQFGAPTSERRYSTPSTR